MVVRIARSAQKASAIDGYVVAILFLNFQPAWESLIRGQLDIVILAGLTGALWLLQAKRAEWLAGVLIALVTMLKLYPGLLAGVSALPAPLARAGRLCRRRHSC